MEKLLDKLNQLVDPAVTAMGCELIGCELRLHRGGGLLRVYIDTPGGVTLEDCERVSRQISAILDVEDPIEGRYSLEVSSPGLDRPLFTVAHYQKYVGNKARIRLHLPLEGRRNFAGIIVHASTTTITLQDEQGKQWQLPFADIEKANLVMEDV